MAFTFVFFSDFDLINDKLNPDLVALQSMLDLVHLFGFINFDVFGSILIMDDFNSDA